MTDAKQVSASELKIHCSEVLDGVRRLGRAVIVTKRGRPIAKIVPVHEEGQRPSLFGFAKGSVTVHGDLMAPIDVDWDAMK